MQALSASAGPSRFVANRGSPAKDPVLSGNPYETKPAGGGGSHLGFAHPRPPGRMAHSKRVASHIETVAVLSRFVQLTHPF